MSFNYGNKRKQNEWTQDEMRYILNNAGFISVEDMSKHLKRTERAIMYKASKMGVSLKMVA